MQKTNPRWKSGRRRKYRQRFKAIEAPCGICKGKLGAIHYDEPSDSKHPLSFVIDEIIPVSKWKEAGYPSAAAAADDFTNLQAAHYICNQMKGNKTNFTLQAKTDTAQEQPAQQYSRKKITLDGKW